MGIFFGLRKYPFVVFYSAAIIASPQHFIQNKNIPRFLHINNDTQANAVPVLCMFPIPAHG